MDEKKKTVEITVDKLDELSDALVIQKQLQEEITSLKEGQLSEEAFMGKAQELVEAQLEEHKKAFKHENERRLTFPTSTITSDKCAVTLGAATKATNRAVKQNLFQTALTMPTGNDDVKALQDLNDELLIVDAIMGKGTHADQYKVSGGMKSLGIYNRYTQQLDAVLKAVAPMDTTDTAEFVPTALSAQILDLPWLYGDVEQLFEHLPCPTSPYKVPIDLTPASTIASLIAEATTNTNNPGDTYGQTLTDGAITFTPAKLRSRLITSAELDEDSVIAWLPYIRKRLAEILGNTVEAAILNGDTTATHMDADIEALGADDGRTAWKGLRKLMIAGSLVDDLTSGNISDANLLTVRASCGKYGVKPKQGAWIFGPISYLKYVLGLTNIVTMEKYGPNATVVQGELSKYQGSPVIVSEHQREGINASGVQDGVTATMGVCMYVNKDCFKIGDRRMVTLKAEEWITTDQINLVAFRRLDFEPLAAPSTTYSFGALGYNFLAS